MTRKTVHFSGTVQGVGFRYTTQRLAGGFDVTGFVRNLPDGRVQLMAEGEPVEVDGLINAVCGAMGSYIAEAPCVESPASGEFREFGIAY